MTQDKWVVLTGASRGIGEATAKRLSRDGYALYLVGRRRDALDALASSLEVPKVVCDFDLTSDHAIEKFCIKLSGERLYGVVNNAGCWAEQRLDDSSHDILDRIMALNVRSVYRLTRGLYPLLQHGGRIVNVSSQLGLWGRAGMAAYVASKHALNGLTKSWALDVGAKQITVNAVCPGWVRTRSNLDEFEALAEAGGMTAVQREAGIAEQLPLKRFIEPDEVASVISFLLSSQASGVTGQIYPLV